MKINCSFVIFILFDINKLYLFNNIKITGYSNKINLFNLLIIICTHNNFLNLKNRTFILQNLPLIIIRKANDKRFLFTLTSVIFRIKYIFLKINMHFNYTKLYY